MKTRAAIAWGPNQPLKIDLEGPKDGEVLVRIVTASLCQRDVFTLSGEDTEGLFPCITHHMHHDQINTAFDFLTAGASIRSAIHFQPDETMTVNALPREIVNR